MCDILSQGSDEELAPLDLCGFKQQLQQNKAALFGWQKHIDEKWEFIMQAVAKKTHVVDDQQTICFDRSGTA